MNGGAATGYVLVIAAGRGSHDTVVVLGGVGVGRCTVHGTT